jgi:cell cycle checkpoint protein
LVNIELAIFLTFQWYLANPHQFHLLSMGTLHSLPSPVPRRSQKYFKPEFFSFLQKEKCAWDSVRATRDWITENEVKVVSVIGDGDFRNLIVLNFSFSPL